MPLETFTPFWKRKRFKDHLSSSFIDYNWVLKKQSIHHRLYITMFIFFSCFIFFSSGLFLFANQLNSGVCRHFLELQKSQKNFLISYLFFEILDRWPKFSTQIIFWDTRVAYRHLWYKNQATILYLQQKEHDHFFPDTFGVITHNQTSVVL